MGNIKFIIQRLKRINIQRFLKVVKKIQKINNKSTFYIIFDIIISSIICGSGYMDYFEFEFHLLTMKQRKTYITGSINNKIVKIYNKKEYRYKFSNKLEFNNKFRDYLGREFLFLNDNYNEFIDFTKSKKEIIVKPIEGCGGVNIEIIKIGKNTYYKKLYNELISKNQLLIEEVINQHKNMSLLYGGSVNTLRIISFKTDEEVVVLKTILKIGNGKRVDNFSNGGMYTFVNDRGFVFVPAIDEDGNVFYEHPISKVKIIDFKIPYYDEVVKLVKEVSLKIPQIRYVGWDIAITPHGPIIVEGNEYSGIFQVKPSISNIKTGDLPNFKKYIKGI